jgi:hypothetical protein
MDVLGNRIDQGDIEEMSVNTRISRPTSLSSSAATPFLQLEGLSTVEVSILFIIFFSCLLVSYIYYL